MSGDQGAKYIEHYFSGVVHPQGLGVSGPQTNVVSQGFGEIVFQIRNSLIAGYARTEQEPKRLEYMRAAIEHAIQGEVNALAVHIGTHLQAELQLIAYPRKTTVSILPDMKSPVIEKRSQPDRDELLALIKSANKGPSSNSIQRILRDFNTALSDLSDAGFLCYRIIETARDELWIRIKQGQAADDREKWENMRNTLSLGRTDLDRVKAAADATRHGAYFNMAIDEYDWIIGYTWQLLLVLLRVLTKHG